MKIMVLKKKLAHPLQDGFELKKIIEPVSRLNFSGSDASYKLGMMGRVNNIDISVQNVTYETDCVKILSSDSTSALENWK